jgi:hypothetical protein
MTGRASDVWRVRVIKTQSTLHTVLAKGRLVPYCVVAHAMLAQIGNMLELNPSDPEMYKRRCAHATLPSLSFMRKWGGM